MTKNPARMLRDGFMRYTGLACTMLFCGCAGLKQAKQDGISQVRDLSRFDGVYENITGTGNPAAFSSLWHQLELHDKPDTVDFRKAAIQLKATGKNRIRATWLGDGVAPQSILLKGKLKHNYFVSKHKRRIIPIPFIYGSFRNNQFQLSLDEHNQLHADRLRNQWGWVFFFLANNDHTTSYEYKRKR